MKYDLLVWNLFYCSTPVSRPSTTEIIYPKVIILAPDWCTCESTYQHLTSGNTDVLKQMRVSCLYEGCNIEGELYRQVLTDGCDLLIATPTIIQDLIQKRLIHFEQLQLIVVSCLSKFNQSFLKSSYYYSSTTSSIFSYKRPMLSMNCSTIFIYRRTKAKLFNMFFSLVSSIRPAKISSLNIYPRRVLVYFSLRRC